MRMVYEHNLKADEAYEKIGEIMERLKRDYGDMITSYSYRWSDDHRLMDYSLSAMGASTRGQVRLDGQNMIIEGSLPFVVRLLYSESALEQMVREQLDLLFAGKPLSIDPKKIL